MKKILSFFTALLCLTIGGKGQTHAFFGMSLTYYQNAYQVYKFDPVTDSLTTALIFDTIDGNVPYGDLMQASNGLLYGMTSQGGLHNLGVVFSFNPVSYRISVLVNFNGANGKFPFGSLIQGYNGLLYGMTSQGGTYNDGVMFSYNIINGQEKTLFIFDSLPYGAQPWGTLTDPYNGPMLYGVTNTGGLGEGNGVLFAYNLLTNNYNIIANSLENTHYSQLTLANDSCLYGMTSQGGIGDNGRIFQLNLNTWTYNDSLFSFNGTDGLSPIGSLVLAPNGILYGMTENGGLASNNFPPGYGVLFGYNPATGKDSVYINFDNDSNGSWPVGSLVLDSANGLLYGTTFFGENLFSFNPNTGAEDSALVLNLYTYGDLLYANTSVNFINDSISGIVYQDNNHNCIYGAGDNPLANVTMEAIYAGNIWATAVSNNDGNYTFYNLPKGYTFNIEIDSTSTVGYKATCPVSGINTDTASSTGNNMAMKCNGGFDLTGELGVCITNPFIGYSWSEITACIYNARCQPVNSSLKLVLDTSIHPFNIIADTAPIISGDTLIWKFDSLGPNVLKNTCITLDAEIDSLPPADSVSVTFIAYPIIGDSVPGNNIITYWLKPNPGGCIGYPYDPNSKTVSPIGDIKPDQQLTYCIHFQNTGTATAQNVVIVDTLSSYIDPTTLQVISSSSPMTTQIIAGGILKFTFSNINLPDTAVSKTNSIGDVIYKIMPISTASKGVAITNSACIYFDAEPGISTNTTYNFIDTTMAYTFVKELANQQHFVCFPNPFNNTTTILFNTDGKHYLEIDDITGRRLKWIEFSGKEYILSRNGLSEGLYFLKAFDNNQHYISTGKLVVE